jgi:virginiamycin B lyase
MDFMAKLRSPLSMLASVLLALLAVVTSAHAAPAVDGEFAVSGKPGYIALGPDGNVWTVLSGSPLSNDVARISPAGVVEEFDVPALAGAVGIAAGPDGNLWVTRSAKVARFTPANPAGATEFAVADLVTPRDITAGPDGNLWAASGDKLLRIPPANPAGYTPFTIAGLDARGLAADGERLWIASFGNGTIYSATTAGAATPHAVGGGPQEVGAGLGGQVAYSNPGGVQQTVGRLTNGGSPLTTPTPGADPFGVAFGADQAYWFAQFASDDLGRLSADGEYSRLTDLSAGSGPRHITAGPGNTLWVSLETAGKVARVVGVEPTAPGPVSGRAFGIAGLKVTPKRFRVAKARTPLVSQNRRGGKRAPAGTRIRFRLNDVATVRMRIERRLAGRRSGRRCLAPRPMLRSRKPCARFVRRGTLVRRNLAAGTQRIAFSGRIGGKALKPGRYRLTAVAVADGGDRSKPRRASFTVVAGLRK